MYEFDYHRPTSIRDAEAILGRCEDPRIIAGGMTLLPAMKLRLSQATDIVDLGAIEALRLVSPGEGKVSVGAMVRHADLAANAVVLASIPALADLAGKIGDPQVRNSGTIGGSVANNDPAADYPAALVALSATVVTNQRRIAADDYFQGMFETALDRLEIIERIEFPIPRRAAYAKFPNPASRYAVVGVFVADSGNAVRVAVTGAGSSVFRIPAMERALGDDFSATAISELGTGDVADLNDDLHASAAYRAHLIGIMAQRAVIDAGG